MDQCSPCHTDPVGKLLPCIMVRYLKTLPISTRLWLLVGIFSLAVLVDHLIEMGWNGKRLRAEKEQQLEQVVEAAYSLLSHYETESRAGRLSDAEARQQAIQAIRSLRYNEREYFWIHDLSQPVPRMVMHATLPELDGTVLDTPDSLRATSSRSGSIGAFVPLDNQNIFIAMNDVVKSPAGKGFVTYNWHKPITSGGVTPDLFPKLSFVKNFEPWGWVIGSGIYMDDFEATYWREAQINILKTGIWIILFGLMAWIVLRTIVRPLRAFQHSIDTLRNNPGSIVTLPTNQPQELEQLSRSFLSLIDQLRLSRQGLQDSLDNLRLAGCAVAEMSEGVMVTDANQRIVSINPAFTRINGYGAAETIGQPASMLKSGKHDNGFYDAMWEDLNTSGFWSGEIWNRAKDGRIYPEWLNITVSIDDQGKTLNYVGVFSDITDRKHNEANIRIAATAFEAQEGMFITDANGIILRVNKAFNEITGYTSEESIGKTPGILSSGRHDAAFYAAMRQTIKDTGKWQGEIWNRRKSGEIFPEWLTITAVKDNEGLVTHHVSTLTDITQRKAAENEIQHLAFYDPLTQLPNRRLLLDRLHHAQASSARTQRAGALMFIDLDNFKTLNDTLGHDKGDLLLQEVAKRLNAAVREGDTVARLGGDEFVVMLEGLNAQLDEAAEQADVIGEKILVALNLAYNLAGLEYRNTPSIGITLFADHNTTIEELLKRADLAMYQAKAAGRNTLRFFDPEMQLNISAQASFEHDLCEAVSTEQFHLHYQAQVNGHGEMIGAEALARWEHPRRGMVSPDEFIPLAEKTKLILPLGRWVLKTACLQLAAWANDPATENLCMAVNISAVQYHQADFVAQVTDILNETNANPNRLKLELTESLMLDNVEDIIVKMSALKASGVSFSLDDFGTGYSSLSYLKRLPLDQLKIDRSFVLDLMNDSNDVAIAKTIVALAESLGLSVIAEGVETEAQRNCLAELGCHNYQGYLFGRPGPADVLFTSMT